jgi:hypothetical protein
LKENMSLAEIKRLARSKATLIRNEVHQTAKAGASAALAYVGCRNTYAAACRLRHPVVVATAASPSCPVEAKATHS